MENYQEIEGNLITLAQAGDFDVIAHGCNCFCQMGAGLAPQMAKAFGCNDPKIFKLEHPSMKGNINKLGQIECAYSYGIKGKYEPNQGFAVVNAYTQYHYGKKFGPPFDLEAFVLCMRKMNHIFKGKHIGLPQIGAGLAGGKWGEIERHIHLELKDCKVTVVIYKP